MCPTAHWFINSRSKAVSRFTQSGIINRCHASDVHPSLLSHVPREAYCHHAIPVVQYGVEEERSCNVMELLMCEKDHEPKSNPQRHEYMELNWSTSMWWACEQWTCTAGGVRSRGQTTSSPCQLVYLMTVVDRGLWVALDKRAAAGQHSVCVCVFFWYVRMRTS